MSDDTDLGRYTVRRCSGCGRNYAVGTAFPICPACDQPIDNVTVTRHRPDERAPSVAETEAELAEIRAAQAAADAQDAERQARAAAALERTIAAATAALHYDLDRWTSDGGDWVAGGSA